MNSISLIGTVSAPPEPGVGGRETRFQVAVPRRDRSGRRQPGVVYVECVVKDSEADDCSRLSKGAVVGLAGRLEVDREHTGEGWRETHTVLVDQLDVVGRGSPNP